MNRVLEGLVEKTNQEEARENAKLAPLFGKVIALIDKKILDNGTYSFLRKTGYDGCEVALVEADGLHHRPGFYTHTLNDKHRVDDKDAIPGEYTLVGITFPRRIVSVVVIRNDWEGELWGHYEFRARTIEFDYAQLRRGLLEVEPYPPQERAWLKERLIKRGDPLPGQDWEEGRSLTECYLLGLVADIPTWVPEKSRGNNHLSSTKAIWFPSESLK
ncbi:MAG: hypothetical protein M1484_00225 [Patescibacteria group bacterium]|nr:hypothetical protein [Patescibacteria group bacterium]MCL5431507.1 hypothetical protein [Patescibacteria group bacterium]